MVVPKLHGMCECCDSIADRKYVKTKFGFKKVCYKCAEWLEKIGMLEANLKVTAQ